MFFHVLNIEREIYWQIGSVTCAAYPLTKLDTIDTDTGGIQKESALNLIVFGEKVDHLDLMEGPVIDLLQAKWHTFVKFRFYKQFIMFFVYFLISVSAFISRPTHRKGTFTVKTLPNATLLNATYLFPNQTGINEGFNSSIIQLLNLTSLLAYPGNSSDDGIVLFDPVSLLATAGNESLIPGLAVDWGNGSDLAFGGGNTGYQLNGSLFGLFNGTNGNTSYNGSGFFLFGWSKCMKEPTKLIDWIRLGSEGCLFLGSISFILGAWRECQFLGASMFFENLVRLS
jgi:transient receptor potential cation channel subfamily V protein 5